nr:PREDICTED: serine/threonine-protein phosphatase 7 long form homolog [Daucus carota subsp. sativus]
MEDILPGPLSQEVILDNSYHVSAAVWAGVDRGPLECFCGNRSMRSWFLSDAQKEILHAIGFGVFANPRLILQTDARLVSALVERWRPETNTFFMRQGEMTVTLEDVGYILGLPIHGRPLVGDVIDNQKDFFRRNWFEELSTADVDSAHTRGGVRYTWLFETYGADPGPDPERILIHTQAYLFVVVGAVLFPTTSRNVVHPRYLRHLRTLREIPTWSWGSAVLSYLYRGLYHATQKDAKKISGCVWLLMLWSYERFEIGRPIPDESRGSYPVAEFWAMPDEDEEDEGKGKKGKVEGKGKGKEEAKGKGKGKGKGKEEIEEEEEMEEQGWIVGGKRKRVRRDSRAAPHHSLPHYRGEFDGVASDVVSWTPYSEFHEMEGDSDGDHDISAEDWEARYAGLARVPLVHYDIVEYQHSDRVLRQFGLRQPIPPPPVSMTRYRQEKEAFHYTDWRAVWFAEIGEWERFVDHPEVVVAQHSLDTDDTGYLDWYEHISRRRVGKPQPVPQPQYSTRELFDNLQAFQLVSLFTLS